jgi:hypothetical protein
MRHLRGSLSLGSYHHERERTHLSGKLRLKEENLEPALHPALSPVGGEGKNRVLPGVPVHEKCEGQSFKVSPSLMKEMTKTEFALSEK